MEMTSFESHIALCSPYSIFFKLINLFRLHRVLVGTSFVAVHGFSCPVACGVWDLSFPTRD